MSIAIEKSNAVVNNETGTMIGFNVPLSGFSNFDRDYGSKIPYWTTLRFGPNVDKHKGKYLLDLSKEQEYALKREFPGIPED